MTCLASARAAVTAAQKALIPDPRNDENLIVAQTHTAMISFHNKVVDKTSKTLLAGAAFRPRPQAGDPALPVAAASRLPAADLSHRRSSTTVFKNGRKLVEPGRPADRRTDHADRVLGRRVPTGPQHDPR